MIRNLGMYVLGLALVCGCVEQAARAKFRASVPWPNLDTPATAVLGGERDSAVIVALEDYAFVATVPGALGNGEAWQRYLTSTLGVPPTRVALLTDQHATKENIESKLDWAAKQAQSGGRVWFVFIGHGAPSRSGQEGLLLGVDAQSSTDSLEARSLRQSDIIARLEAGVAQPVLVLDACFSGRTSSDESLCAGCQPVTLAPVPKPERAIVLSAGKSDQVAGPLPGRAQPAFSYLVLGALRGWGDDDGDGTVTANEVITYANGAMGALVHGRTQTAEVFGDGGFALVESAGERGPDLAEIQRLLSRSGVGGINGDGIVLTTLATPKLRNPERGEQLSDLSNIDWAEEKQKESKYLSALAYQQKVDAALNSGSNDITGLKQEKAWCELAELPDPNPHRDEATKACADVRVYIEQRKRLIAAMRRDWNETVVPFINLAHRSTVEKRKVMQAFVEEYEVLADQGEVIRGRYVVKQLRRGGTPVLMPIGEQVFIPGGTFPWLDPEEDKPVVKSMEVAGFWLDKTEVTVAAYRVCKAAGACTEPYSVDACNGWGRDGHPVNCVGPAEAEAYCEWVGGRLPTEYELAWATQSRDKEWTYPWGNATPNGRACLDRKGGTCEVGYYPEGASVDGVLDLVGNVEEWTSTLDWRMGGRRVAWGGAWEDEVEWGLEFRDYELIGVATETNGFRCAKSI